jgi:hypothetical protein
MTDHLPPPISSNTPAPKKATNCWVAGCGGCLGLLALLILTGMIIGRLVMVDPFKPVELSATEIQASKLKIEALEMNTQSDVPKSGLRLQSDGIRFTEQEVNYWISQSSDEMAGMLRIDFEPGEIIAQLRAGEGPGKRINLMGRVSVAKAGEQFDIRLLEVKLGKFPFPASAISKFKDKNLIEEIFRDPEERKLFEESIESIEILKDQILIIPKQP